MSLFQSTLQSPHAYRLGWALLHSLWEGAAVSLSLMFFLLLARKAAPQTRYLASCAAMLAMFVLPIVTFCLLQPPLGPIERQSLAHHEILPPSPGPITAPLSARPAPIIVVEPVIMRQPPMHASLTSAAPVAPAHRVWPDVVEWLQPAVPWLVLAWMCGVAGLSLWNFGGWVALQRLKVISAAAVDEQIHDLADRLRRRMGVRRAVRLLNSTRVISPIVIGAFKPVILLPASALCELSMAQLESILAHELAHIRRNDYLANLIQSVIETLMFYHPAVWWIGRRIRIERENCCDDIALSQTADRIEYARALTLVARRASSLVPAASGGVLLARVRRILGLPAADVARAPRWLSGALMLAVALALSAFLHPRSPAVLAAEKPPQTQPATLTLTVLDEDSGQRLEGVNIHVVSRDKVPKVTTDANGRATLQLPRSDLSMNVWARRDGYVPTVAATSRLYLRFSVRRERIALAPAIAGNERRPGAEEGPYTEGPSCRHAGQRDRRGPGRPRPEYKRSSRTDHP